MTAGLLVAIALGMLLVRVGWGGQRHAAPAGWAITIAASAVLVARDGAWGLAMGGVVAMTVAVTIVLHAGWAAPARARRAPREAPSITLPRRPGDLARRIAVFVLVVPAAFAAAQWLAYGAQALARRAGAGEADAIVLTMFLQPTLWGVLMVWQMTRPGPMRMIAPPLAATALGTALWAGS